VTGSALVYTAPLKVKGRSERLGRADGLGDVDFLENLVGEADVVPRREPIKVISGDGEPKGEEEGLRERHSEALAEGVVTAKFFVSEPWMLMPSPVVGVHVAP